MKRPFKYRRFTSVFGRTLNTGLHPKIPNIYSNVSRKHKLLEEIRELKRNSCFDGVRNNVGEREASQRDYKHKRQINTSENLTLVVQNVFWVIQTLCFKWVSTLHQKCLLDGQITRGPLPPLVRSEGSVSDRCWSGRSNIYSHLTARSASSLRLLLGMFHANDPSTTWWMSSILVFHMISRFSLTAPAV